MTGQAKNQRRKVAFKCDQTLKAQFSNASCLLSVSPGQNSQEAEKFSVTLELIDRSFDSCDIIIDDSLQRFTLALIAESTEPHRFIDQALNLGDAWLQRHAIDLERMKSLHRIHRWEDWREQDLFKQTYAKISAVYQQDKVYKAAIESSVQEFLSRYQRRDVISAEYLTQASVLSRDFLLEESTVFYMLAVNESYDFEVYPSQRNQALDYIHQKLIVPECGNKLVAVSLKFKELHQLPPQYVVTSKNSENI